MENKNVVKLHLIETEQIKNFTKRERERLGVPECLLAEYSVNDWFEMNNGIDKEITPLHQYNGAEGYEFRWGHILERRSEQYIVWDFCFLKLLHLYLKHEKGLGDIQKAAFYILERSVDCCTRDIVSVLSMEEGWKIIPCSSVGAFSFVIHFTDEEKARQWAVDNLLTDTVHTIIRKLQKDVVDKKE